MENNKDTPDLFNNTLITSKRRQANIEFRYRLPLGRMGFIYKMKLKRDEEIRKLGELQMEYRKRGFGDPGRSEGGGQGNLNVNINQRPMPDQVAQLGPRVSDGSGPQDSQRNIGGMKVAVRSPRKSPPKSESPMKMRRESQSPKKKGKDGKKAKKPKEIKIREPNAKYEI